MEIGTNAIINSFVGSRRVVSGYYGGVRAPGLGYNLVDAAQSITPVDELWTFKNNDSSLLIMMPYNGTQAYYYDIVNVGDDCMVLRNCFRRLYTKPDANTLNTSTIQSQVKTGSNLELAVRLRKANTAHAYRFIPQHESVNTCVLNGTRTFRRNGTVFTANDVKYIQCQSTSVESTYNCIHPEEASPLASLFMRHTVTPAKIRADIQLTFLQDTQIDVGYSIMNNTTLTPKSAAVGIGRSITPVTLTGSNQAAPGQGSITSCAMGQTGDSTVMLADWSGNFGSVLASQEFVGSLFQWFVASTSKFYNTPFSNCVIPAGRSFPWSGEWRLAEWAALFA